MSKIINNEFEAKTTDQDLTISPNGNGIVEVTGDGSDALLKLKNAQQTNCVKIKAPPDSASQDHTLILPDNQIAADKFLKVKSITGSGSTAVGQLEYATITTVTDLNASNLTSGTIPSARLPNSLSATDGAGFQLVKKITISTPVAYADLNDSNNNAQNSSYNQFDPTSAYRIFGKNITIVDASSNQGNSNITLSVHNSAGTGTESGLTYTYVRFSSNNTSSVFSSTNASDVLVGNGSSAYFNFTADIYPQAGYNFIHWVSHQFDDYRTKAYISFNSSNSSKNISGIRLRPSTSSRFFGANSQFLVYKYNED